MGRDVDISNTASDTNANVAPVPFAPFDAKVIEHDPPHLDDLNDNSGHITLEPHGTSVVGRGKDHPVAGDETKTPLKINAPLDILTTT